MSCTQPGHKRSGEHRGDRLRADRSLHRRKTRVCVASRGSKSRALNTLRFLWKKLPNHRGFFYHWGNINTGERIWDSEVSSVDTAILLCGVLTCRAHFIHSEISELALEIFNRVDWNWLSEDTPILPHGWTPETGFLQYRWGEYSEMMMMYLLGLGSAIASAARRSMEQLEANHIRIRRHPLYRILRTSIHPSVFAGLV